MRSRKQYGSSTTTKCRTHRQSRSTRPPVWEPDMGARKRRGAASITGTGSMVRMFVSYYTGTPDAVPHVPERCMVAGGAKGLAIYYREMELDSARLYHITEGDDERRQLMARTEQGHKVRMPTNEVTVRAFDSPMFSDGSPSTVMYFFAANGRYIADPKGVRALVFDLRDEYAYWCKIELVAGHLAAGGRFVGEGPADDPVATAERFLTYALPEIMVFDQILINPLLSGFKLFPEVQIFLLNPGGEHGGIVKLDKMPDFIIARGIGFFGFKNQPLYKQGIQHRLNFFLGKAGFS